jgi:DNA-binding transcriptional ArsR family regulator
MRLMLIGLCLACLPAAAFTSSAPIMAAGTIEVHDAAWIWIIGDFQTHLAADSWSATQAESYATRGQSPVAAVSTPIGVIPAGNPRSGESAQVAVVAADGHGLGRFIGRLNMTMLGSGQVVPARGLPASHYLPADIRDDVQYTGLWNDVLDSDAVVVATSAGGKIEGAITAASWGDSATACATSACPPPAGRREIVNGSYYNLERIERTDFSSFARIAVTFADSTVLIGYRSTALFVDGATSVPGFRGDQCSECEGAQTLHITGRATFRQLRTTAGGFNGSLEYAAGTAGIDELEPRAWDLGSLQSPVLVVAAATSLGIGVKAIAALVTAHGIKQPLANPRRKALLDEIVQHPGATFRELVRRSSIPAGTARHHLTILKRSGLIVEHGHKATRRFFENHGKFDLSWQQVVALREPELKELHAWLVARPGWHSQKEVIAGMSVLGWSRSTTQHRLARLVAHGAVSLRLQGRLKMYSPAPTATGRPSGPGLSFNPAMHGMKGGAAASSPVT